MAIFRADCFHAACRINGSGDTLLLNQGFSGLADTGVGDRLLTFDVAIAVAERNVLSSRTKDPAGGFAITVQTSSTQMQVLLFDAAGAAADFQTDHLVLRVA